ncbi:MAG: 30S ribosomal protein S3 [Candidatus Andersenbacteria bacterium]
MGRKTHPVILRVSNILRSWDPQWFADRRGEYRDWLTRDLKIRQYLQQQLRTASISRVEIAREQKETILTIHTSRPAVVIGRGGTGIEKIQKDLRRLLGGTGRLRINVQEIRNPDTDAAAVATQIVDQLERRMPFRRALKHAVSRAMQAGALGARVAVAGRLNGSEIARTEWLADGNVPLHTFRADISYCQSTAFTTYGTIGVKVWINRGELIKSQEEKPGESRKAVVSPKARRQRQSLAEVAKSPRPARTRQS